MRFIIISLLLGFISISTFSQDFFNRFNLRKQVKEDIDYSYLDEEYIKKGINKEIAFAKATKALERMSRGNFEQAYEDIKQVIKLDPENDYPYVLKGLCCIELDSIQQSKKAFEKANEIDENNDITNFYLGYISRIYYDYDKAKKYYKSIIKNDRKSFLGYYGLGNMYFYQEKYLDARKYYVKAVTINPDFYEGFYNLGIIELLYRKSKMAIKYLQSAVVSNNEFSNAYQVLGYTYYYYEDEEALAKEYWDKAIKLEPDKPLHLLSRAVWYINNNDIESGYNDIAHMIKANEGNTYLFSDFGDFYDEKVKNSVRQFVVFDQNIDQVQDTIKPMLKWYLCYSIYGYYQYAKEKIEEAYKVDSTGAIINYFRGNEHENYLYYPEAIKYYEKSVNKAPFISETYLKLGILNFRTEKYNKSIDYITTFLNFNDTAKIAYRCRGTSYMKIGKIDKALADFNCFLKKDSTDFDILFNKSVCHKELEQYLEAIFYFKKAIVIKPDNYESYYLSAICKFELSNFNEALVDMDSIPLIYYESNSKAYHLRGKLYAELKQFIEAINDYSKALDDDPGNVEILGDRGKLFYSIGDNKRALKDYTELISEDPEIAAAYYIRGIIYVKLKEFNKACIDFKTAESKGYQVPQNAFAICNINI